MIEVRRRCRGGERGVGRGAGKGGGGGGTFCVAVLTSKIADAGF